MNTAGIPWANSQALRRRGVESDLLVFNRYKLHPEADISLERHGNLLRQQATQWRAFLELLPRYDVFHFYSSVTLVPKSVQFRILHALGKKGVYQYLGSDIRGKTREQLAYGLAGRRGDRLELRRDPLGARRRGRSFRVSRCRPSRRRFRAPRRSGR